MKNNFIFLIATCLTILTISCQKEKEMIVQEKPSDIHTLSVAFPEMTDQNGTKVSLATDGTTGWAVGDKIVIYGNPSSSDATKRVVHEIVAGDIADPKVAVFSVDLSGLDAQFNSASEGVYFPYTVAYPYTEGQPYYLSTGENNYGRSRFQNTNQLLMAGHVSDDNSSIVLNHLTAAITFSVSGDFDSYTFSGADGTEVVGYSSLVVEMNRRSLGEGKYRQKYNDGGTTGPLTSIQGSVNGNGTSVNHIFLPVNAERSGSTPYDLASKRYADVVYLPDGFTIKFFKGGDLKKYITSSAPLIIKPGHMINLGLLPAGSMHDYAPTSHNSSIGCPADNSIYDLSKDASANCYIVDGSNDDYKDKVFKFKAYKGKSTTNVGTIDSVSILWETWNNAETVTENSVIAAVDYDKQSANDYYEICFKMPSTIHAGNALIAAKNAGGNILWSWHIWVPSTTITSSTYGNVSKVRMMDRNLGALVIAEGDAETDAPIESAGMFYQWGRKDPFIGTQSFGSSSLAKYSGTFATREKTSYTEIYKYPNSFVLTGYDTDGYKDWSTTTSDALWGSTKTENDPCPPGWKVPYSSNSGDLWDNAGGSLTELPGFSFNVDHHWFRLGVDFNALSPTTTGYVYFPLPGYKVQSNGNFEYKGSRTSIIQANTGGGNNEYTRTILFKSGSDFKGFQWERKARGCSVRCVAE